MSKHFFNNAIAHRLLLDAISGCDLKSLVWSDSQSFSYNYFANVCFLVWTASSDSFNFENVSRCTSNVNHLDGIEILIACHKLWSIALYKTLPAVAVFSVSLTIPACFALILGQFLQWTVDGDKQIYSQVPTRRVCISCTSRPVWTDTLIQPNHTAYI